MGAGGGVPSTPPLSGPASPAFPNPQSSGGESGFFECGKAGTHQLHRDYPFPISQVGKLRPQLRARHPAQVSCHPGSEWAQEVAPDASQGPARPLPPRADSWLFLGAECSSPASTAICPLQPLSPSAPPPPPPLLPQPVFSLSRLCLAASHEQTLRPRTPCSSKQAVLKVGVGCGPTPGLSFLPPVGATEPTWTRMSRAHEEGVVWQAF